MNNSLILAKKTMREDFKAVLKSISDSDRIKQSHFLFNKVYLYIIYSVLLLNFHYKTTDDIFNISVNKSTTIY